MPFDLLLFPQRYAVVKLPSQAAIPTELFASGAFCSITKTPTELSIVCEERLLKPEMLAEQGWRLLGIQGTLNFNMVGVLSQLSAVLASAKISIFVLSTHDTDYVMVKEDTLREAISALKTEGYRLKTLLGEPVFS